MIRASNLIVIAYYSNSIDYLYPVCKANNIILYLYYVYYNIIYYTYTCKLRLRFTSANILLLLMM
jgi:hypothetical protein